MAHLTPPHPTLTKPSPDPIFLENLEKNELTLKKASPSAIFWENFPVRKEWTDPETNFPKSNFSGKYFSSEKNGVTLIKASPSPEKSEKNGLTLTQAASPWLPSVGGVAGGVVAG